MIIGAAVGCAASYQGFVQHYRRQLGPMTLREARLLKCLPATPIAEASSGLVKLVGVVGASATAQSYYHRVPCACLELHHYETHGSAGGNPRRVFVRKERDVHPFWIDDGTGRLVIDPARARIDYEIEGTDQESSIEEHRIRVGERVAVLATLRCTAPQLTHPMRKAPSDFESRIEIVGECLVTWRSEPEVYPHLAPPIGSVALSAGSLGMAVLGAILNL